MHGIVCSNCRLALSLGFRTRLLQGFDTANSPVFREKQGSRGMELTYFCVDTQPFSAETDCFDSKDEEQHAYSQRHYDRLGFDHQPKRDGAGGY